MRALTLAIALVLLSLSMSVVSEVFGGGSPSGAPHVQYSEANPIGSLKSIVEGAVKFGDTVNDIVVMSFGFGIPSGLRSTLNFIGEASVAIAIIQFVWRIAGGGME